MQPDEQCPQCGARLHLSGARDREIHCQECGSRWELPGWRPLENPYDPPVGGPGRGGPPGASR